MILEAIRVQLRRTVPFARLLGIDVESLSACHAVAQLTPRGSLQDHAGGLHAGALFALCESASGAALSGALCDVIMCTRFAVRDARIEFVAPGTTQVQAKATLVGTPGDLVRALRRDRRVAAAVDVEASMSGAEGERIVVARACFSWHVRVCTPYAGNTPGSPGPYPSRLT